MEKGALACSLLFNQDQEMAWVDQFWQEAGRYGYIAVLAPTVVAVAEAMVAQDQLIVPSVWPLPIKPKNVPFIVEFKLAKVTTSEPGAVVVVPGLYAMALT